MKIEEFINKMNLLQRNLLEFLEDDENVEEKYLNLINLCEDQNICKNHDDFKLFLSILLNIASNHQRSSNMYSKIEQILTFFKDEIPNIFNNMDLFDFFIDNKNILLFLIQNHLLVIDKSISTKIISYQHKEAKYSKFFFPEIKLFIKNNSIELPENFEENRQIGENEDEICQIIRSDLLNDFISIIDQNKIQLTSKINQSIYETNSFLYQNKDITLIEYAAFYGSIQIFKYLHSKGVKLNSNLWFYSIHSNNIEMIQFLEKNKIDPPYSSYDLCFKESIKCFHNDIANYIQNKYLSSTENDENEDSENIQFLNFEFIKPYYNDKNILFKLVEYNLIELLKIYFKSIEYDVNEIFNSETLLIKAVQNNQLEIARLILSQSKLDVNLRAICEIQSNKWAKRSALHIAIENGNQEIVKLLLSHSDIDVNLKYIESNDEKDIKKEKANKIKIEKVTLNKKSSKYLNVVDDVETSIRRKEMTPLYIAIKRNNIQIINLLLNHSDIDVNDYSNFYDFYSFRSVHDDENEESLITKTKSSKTALEIAIKNKSLEIVKSLLNAPGIDINNESKRQQYIQYYYYKKVYSVDDDDDDDDVVDVVVADDEDFDVLNSNGTSTRTPLFSAIMKENLPIIELILNQPDIDVNYPSHIYDTDQLISSISDDFGYKEDLPDIKEIEKLIKNYDQQPLVLAFEKGNTEIVDLLLNDPDVDSNFTFFLPSVVQKGNLKIIQFLLEREFIDVNDEIIEGQSLLHYAVQEDNIEMVKYLIDYPNINVNMKSQKGDTPLTLAIEFDRIEIVKLLLKNPNVDVNCHKNSKSPLHYAIKAKNDELAFLLLKNLEIDVNRLTSNGISPLYLAIENENIDIVNALLRNPDIDVNIQTINGETPLHLAVKKGNEIIVKLLLRNPDIDVNIESNSKQVPLYFAFSQKNDNIIDDLLKRPEIDPNIILEDGYTPLIRSIEDEHIGRIKILLSNDITDVNMMGGNGQLPINLAVLTENITIFELLMKHPDLQFNIHSILGEDVPFIKANMLFITFREKNQKMTKLFEH